ncbi:hypothetical protein SAMN05878482_10526 [Peribacillus simplex]|uniref:Uncharacterized protein n=1 Tax=Peribacillus simplex TaxID=1478 RepID=A0A9X8RAW0_9BACI|nr:hypothetical protein [Peribacillus simplex]SIR68477.1 hypothetical protein SAMN05878482_10526 [Peribacillus simplex]
MKLSEEIRSDLIRKTLHFFRDKLNGLSGEVKMLDAMHRDISDLGTDWNNVLASTPTALKISMDSYFIHQTPKVSYTGIKKTSIEFGDVLYLYTETDNKNYKRETALLMQAKVYEDKKVDAHQLKLYTDWPTFWFQTQSIHASRFNVVTTPQPHLGGRYLLLDDSTKNNEFASSVTPTPGLRANMHDNFIERELVGLLEFSHGRELLGDWGTAIKAAGNHVKVNGKIFNGASRSQPLLYALNNGSGSGTPNPNDPKKGFWFVHIQANVPFPD